MILFGRPFISCQTKGRPRPFAVIRETIRSLDKVALARVVLTNREHVIAWRRATRV